MRELTSHQAGVAGDMNEAIQVKVMDKPGAGGACHAYAIDYIAPPEAPEVQRCGIASWRVGICFQKGPVLESGPNGISIEALLAIVKDRLVGFQAGEFACGCNQLALFHVDMALRSLHNRTRERAYRGVEGTSQK